MAGGDGNGDGNGDVPATNLACRQTALASTRVLQLTQLTFVAGIWRLRRAEKHMTIDWATFELLKDDDESFFGLAQGRV